LRYRRASCPSAHRVVLTGAAAGTILLIRTAPREGAGTSEKSLPTLRVIGPGRAGRSLSLALDRAGWRVLPLVAHGDDVTHAAAGADLLVIATPDAAIADIAQAVPPVESTVVAHLAGSLGLDVLAPHKRRASLHPLVPLADPELGSRQIEGAWFAIAGDDLAARAVADLGGHAVPVADADRAAYHAAACIASNHLVALLGQAERVAASAGVPLAAYFDLVRATVDNVERLGPAAALTGPAARGDWSTVDAHRRALSEDEREAYDVMVRQCTRLKDVAPCR
jgi:predicted short-subunit dehydrogenase-like oxidoreductase (DUF2520 family)